MKYTAQKPAEGINITNKFPDALYYRTNCNCGDPHHDITLSVEYEEDIHNVTLHIYTEIETNLWKKYCKVDYTRWYAPISIITNAVMNRIVAIYDVLIKGTIRQESCLVMNEQEAVNFATAIIDGINYVTPVKKTNTYQNNKVYNKTPVNKPISKTQTTAVTVDKFSAKPAAKTTKSASLSKSVTNPYSPSKQSNSKNNSFRSNV